MADEKCPLASEYDQIIRRKDLTSLADHFADSMKPISQLVTAVCAQGATFKGTERALRITNWSVMFLNVAVLLVLGIQLFVLQSLQHTTETLRVTSTRLSSLEHAAQATSMGVAAVQRAAEDAQVRVAEAPKLIVDSVSSSTPSGKAVKLRIAVPERRPADIVATALPAGTVEIPVEVTAD